MIPILALFTKKGQDFMKQQPVLFVILTLIALAAGAVFYEWVRKTKFEQQTKD